MKHSSLNNKGFSLIELMVVVAIIGILASFAIPQYQTFQSKSRQKEGLLLLSSFYTAAQASLVELGAYPGNFAAMGFSPSGTLHYRITSIDNAVDTVTSGHPDVATCIDTIAATVCTGGVFTVTWVEETANPAFKATAKTITAVASNTAFLAGASAIIKPGGTADEWTVNQLKTFAAISSGL